jgi:hypothetical protein
MGTNTYWIGFLTDNADVDLVMSHLVAVCQYIYYPARISADSDLVGPESSPCLGIQRRLVSPWHWNRLVSIIRLRPVASH